jgi:hypothetical protein
LRIEQALQVVGPRSVTSHIRRQALESAAESLEPTFALEFPKYEERPRGSVVAFALRASARHLAIARLNSLRAEADGSPHWTISATVWS